MAKEFIEFYSRSPAETKKIGRLIGKKLRAGDVVALEGELGSGKTTLAKGIAAGLSVPPEEVTSPTFTLIHEYQGREKLFHIDWYRLRSVRGVDERLAAECFESPAVTLVEWPERGRGILPRELIRIRLEHAGRKKRIIKITGWPAGVGRRPVGRG